MIGVCAACGGVVVRFRVGSERCYSVINERSAVDAMRDVGKQDLGTCKTQGYV